MTSRLQGTRAFGADLRCQIRRDGVRPTLTRVGGRVRSSIHSRQDLIVLLKDLDQIVDVAAEADLRLEDLEAAHLPALSELNRRRCFTRADRRFARDVERGYRGFVAFRGRELVGYYWWVDRGHHPPHRDLATLGLDIRLEEHDAYGSDFFITEEHRRGGTANDVLAKLESTLRERGYRRLWGYVVSSNRPARWLYSTRGYEPRYRVRTRRVLSRRIARRVEADQRGS